jgi:DNA repair photolyase
MKEKILTRCRGCGALFETDSEEVAKCFALHLRDNLRCCDAYSEANELVAIEERLVIKPSLHVIQPGDNRIFHVAGISPNSEATIFGTFNGRNLAYNFFHEVMGMTNDKRKISGTLEWADGGCNCVKGCIHNCKYCYSRHDALEKFNRIASVEEWRHPVVQDHRVRKVTINWYTKKRQGATIMFPTTHDITEECLEPCVEVMHKLLGRGYNLLIVSKPHRECIERICDEFSDFKEKILFRFTIGAMNDDILQYWEPGAPNFRHRLDCLEYAFYQGYQTSVSCEPMLDSEHIVDLVTSLEPFATNSIWLGKMNKTDSRVRIESVEDQDAIQNIIDGQTDDRIWEIYKSLRDHPLVKWKESIKEVVGLDLAEEAGLDK